MDSKNREKAVLVEENDECRPLLILVGIDPRKIFNEVKEAHDKKDISAYLDKLKFPQIPFDNVCGSVPLAKLPDGRVVHIVEKKGNDIKDTDELNLAIKGKSRALKNYWVTERENVSPLQKRCEHCHRIPKNPIGCPVDVIINDFNEVMEFIFEGYFCHTRCVLAKLNSSDSCTLLSNSPKSQNSRFLLRILNRYIQKSQGLEEYNEIIPAPPMNMHQDNGGPLDDEKFDSGAYRYETTINIRMREVTSRLIEREPVVHLK